MENMENFHGMKGNLQGNTPAYFISVLKKLSCAFEMVCEGGEEELKTERIPENIHKLKVAVGTEDPAHGLVKQIEQGFNSIMEKRIHPDHLQRDTYRQDFQKLLAFFKRYHLTPESVFETFGTKIDEAADHLGVDLPTLERYVTEVLRIENWPIGKRGYKVLVQVGKGMEPCVYAMDVKRSDGIEVVRDRIWDALDLGDNAAHLGYDNPETGSFLEVNTEEEWVNCKKFYKKNDRVKLYVDV